MMEKYFKKVESNQTTRYVENTHNLKRCSISDSAQKSPPTKIKNISKYKSSWEDDPILKPWLININNKPYCRVCACELRSAGGVRDLKHHAQTLKHTTNSKAIAIHKKSSQLFAGISSVNQSVVKTELQLSAFCAEHNISFTTMDHLIPMLKNAIPDSQILKNMTCARTKTTAIIKNVIAPSHLEELCGFLNENYFSLCVDESTDISTTKLLSLVVRTSFNDQIQDFFFALLKVEACDANSIYSNIVKYFNAKNIDYKNLLIGFGADGANVMTGANHSVATMLKNDCPNLVIFKCSCHSFALCANHACKYLPKFIETCAREMYNFIQNSPKRIELYSSLQILLNYKPIKLLHPSQTRWLSLEATVNQILSRYDVLRLFFIHEDVAKFESVQRINQNLQNPEFELYLKFLKFILGDINQLNRLFQKESPQLHRLYEEITRLYTKIFESFVKAEFLAEQHLNNVDLNNLDILKDLKDIYLGADVTASLSTTHILCPEKELEFRSHCQQFYLQLCNHLTKKFDFGNKLIIALQILGPNNIINKKIPNSCVDLVIFFPNLVDQNDYQQVDDEWRELRHFNFNDTDFDEKMEIDIFWSKIFQLKRCDGSICFPFLKKIIMAILTIPVATANVERIFSVINLNKTKVRNRLDVPTLSGILLTKEFMKKSDNNCINFEPNKKMYQLFNNQMYLATLK